MEFLHLVRDGVAPCIIERIEERHAIQSDTNHAHRYTRGFGSNSWYQRQRKANRLGHDGIGIAVDLECRVITPHREYPGSVVVGQGIAGDHPSIAIRADRHRCIRPGHFTLHMNLLRIVPGRAMYPVADMACSTTAERGHAGIHIATTGFIADLAIAQRKVLCIQLGNLPYFVGVSDGQAKHENKEYRQRLHHANLQFG
jgi:hypothetical protein